MRIASRAPHLTGAGDTMKTRARASQAGDVRLRRHRGSPDSRRSRAGGMTRLLSLLLAGTVYTFSIILAVFLLGLWAGKQRGIGCRAAHFVSGASPGRGVRRCLVLSIGGRAQHARKVTALLPLLIRGCRSIRCSISTGPRAMPVGDPSRTLLWGASFPSRPLARRPNPAKESRGPLTGEIYAREHRGPQ
jgi:hypothetical protein